MARKERNPSDDNIWLRQPGETEKAFAAFQCYLDLGLDRTIAEVGRKQGKSRSQIDEWRNRYDWKNRASAYDNWLVSSKAKKTRKEVEARYERLGRMSDQLLGFGAALLKTADPSKLSHKEAIDYMKLALNFAQANREMFALTEAEQTRTDVELLRIETTQSMGSAAGATSNFEEALMTVAPNIWDEENEKEVSDDELNDSE
ncbi:MAG: hypothetical protein LBQ15_09070 [Clostridium sp.]|jgi:transposase-like protein|nr:hypothetical protein [Clostridium sp.]